MGCIVGGHLHLIGEHRGSDQHCAGHGLMPVQAGVGCLRTFGEAHSGLTDSDVFLGLSR